MKFAICSFGQNLELFRYNYYRKHIMPLLYIIEIKF